METDPSARSSVLYSPVYSWTHVPLAASASSDFCRLPRTFRCRQRALHMLGAKTNIVPNIQREEDTIHREGCTA